MVIRAHLLYLLHLSMRLVRQLPNYRPILRLATLCWVCDRAWMGFAGMAAHLDPNLLHRFAAPLRDNHDSVNHSFVHFEQVH